jgi:hypothetical protein
MITDSNISNGLNKKNYPGLPTIYCKKQLKYINPEVDLKGEQYE